MNILTKEALNHLLRVYAEEGGDAARALAPSYGVGPKYIRKLACKHGVKVKRKRSKAKTNTDRRWQWAIERGAVRI